MWREFEPSDGCQGATKNSYNSLPNSVCFFTINKHKVDRKWNTALHFLLSGTILSKS